MVFVFVLHIAAAASASAAVVVVTFCVSFFNYSFFLCHFNDPDFSYCKKMENKTRHERKKRESINYFRIECIVIKYWFKWRC